MLGHRKIITLVFFGILGTAFLAVFYFIIFPPKNEVAVVEPKETEWTMTQNGILVYGVLRHFSNAGAMTFDYYDIENGSVLNKEDKPWFWAQPNINNREKTDNFIGLIENNEDSVFKIMGRKMKDNCGFEEGFCFEDIEIDEISIVGKANLTENKSYIDYSKYEGETTEEEEKIIQDGRIDGFYDAVYSDRKFKQGYIEPDTQEYLIDLYHYGYLLGFYSGCKQEQKENANCETVLELLKNMYDNAEPGNDIYVDPALVEIVA
jgi:hypothetical protein